MAIQKYSATEAINRILRSLGDGIAPSSDGPGTLPGEIFSESEALSRIAELLEGSLDGVSIEYPQALNTQLIGSVILAASNPDSTKFIECDGREIDRSSITFDYPYPVIENKVVMLGQAGSPKGCAVIGDTFLVIDGSANPKFYYSSDFGETWDFYYATSGSSIPLKAENGVGFLFSSASTRTYYRSTDGITWATGSMAFNGAWSKIAYGSGTYVALASVGVGYSSDGIVWSSGSSNGITSSLDISYAGGKFFCYTSSNVIYSTDDVSSWATGTFSTSQLPSSYQVIGIMYDENETLWRAMVVSSQLNGTFTSNDGVVWAYEDDFYSDFHGYKIGSTSVQIFSRFGDYYILKLTDRPIIISPDFGKTWKPIISEGLGTDSTALGFWNAFSPHLDGIHGIFKTNNCPYVGVFNWEKMYSPYIDISTLQLGYMYYYKFA